MSKFIVLTNCDGNPVAFNLANVVAIQPEKDGGASVWTVPCVSSEGWGNWLVQESFGEIGKLMNWVAA